jgi:hypothetical protein
LGHFRARRRAGAGVSSSPDLTDLGYPAAMQRHFNALAILLLALVLAACGKVPRLDTLGANDVVLAFGDSPFGTGAAPRSHIRRNWVHSSTARWVNAGVPGEVSADGLARLPALLEEHRPKLLISATVATTSCKLPEAAAADNIRAMIRLAKAQGVEWC